MEFSAGLYGHHWLSTNPDSLIIYNDLRQGKFVSIILNVHTKEEKKVIPFPINFSVSPSGKEQVSINFSRLREMRFLWLWWWWSKLKKIKLTQKMMEYFWLIWKAAF